MKSSGILRVLPDNKVIEVRACDGGFAAWVRCGKWSAWKGGFYSAEAALAWGEATERDDEVELDESRVGG